MDSSSKKVEDGSESCRTTPRPKTAASSISSASSSRSRRVSGRRCDCGRPHEVSKFCQTCDVVCCAECCFDQHRDGCSVKHLQEVVKDANVSKVNEQALIKKLDKQRKQRQDDLQSLLRQKEQMAPSVSKVYDSMKKELNELQKQDIQKGEEKFREFDEHMKQDIDDCTKAIDCLKAVNKHPSKDEHFINYKQAEKLTKQLEENIGSESLEYLAQDSAIENLKGMKFGYFLGDLCIDLADFGKVDVPRGAADDEISVNAMCEMPDGTLVVATNILVKLDEEYKPQCETEIPGHPSDMCYVGNGKVVICIKSWKYEGLFLIVRVPSGSKKEISVGLQKDPTVNLPFIGQRMACVEGTIYIQDYKDVHTNDTHGKHITTFYQGSIENGMIDITADKTRKQIFIADKAKGIVVMDKAGKVLLTVSDPDLIDMCSICIDRIGQIFVACATTKRILLFNRKGQKQGVAKCLKKTGEPHVMAMQRKFNRLLVTLKGSCDLMVYSLPSLDFYRDFTR